MGNPNQTSSVSLAGLWNKMFFLLLASLLFNACAEKSHLTSQSSTFETKTEATKSRRAEALFLGHASDHHPSRKYAPWLATAVFASGINITYTEELADLNPDNLDKYDGLVIYANHDYLAPEQENALKEFLDRGKGLIPLHSASGCFKNSDWYIHTIGGQFASHGTGDFVAEIVEASHPILDGVDSFETWDETYVHKNLNPDIEVLTERLENGQHEPYT